MCIELHCRSFLFFVPVEIIKIFYTFGSFSWKYPIFLFQFLVLLLSSRYNEKQKFFAPDADATGRERDNEEEQIHIPNLFLNMLQSQLFFNVPSSRKYSDRKIEGKTLSQFSQMRALNVHKEKYYYVVKVKIGIRRYVSTPPSHSHAFASCWNNIPREYYEEEIYDYMFFLLIFFYFLYSI